MSKDIEEDIAAAEAEWQQPPSVVRDEPPETALAVRVHNCFIDHETMSASIAKRADELGLLKDGKLVPVTPENVEHARTLNGLCRKASGLLAKTAKTLKEEALAWQRAVNAKQGELAKAIDQYKVPLAAGIKAVDDEAERIKREEEEAERKAIEDAARAEYEERMAAEKAERDAELARIKAEADRLAAERKQFEEQQAAAKAEADRVAAEAARKLAEERAEIEAEKKRLDDARRADEEKRQREERERQAVAEAQQRAIDEAKREAERKAKAEADAAAEAERLARIAPDKTKLAALAAKLRKIAIAMPEVSSPEAERFIGAIKARLSDIANTLETFGN